MTRSLILIIALSLVSFCSLGQNRKKESYLKPRIYTKQEYAITKKHYECFFNGKFSARQRRFFFPFNDSFKVRLISYIVQEGPEFYGFPDSLIVCGPRDKLPIFIPRAKSVFMINMEKVREQKTLSIAGIDSLTNILYNYGYTPVKWKGEFVPDPGPSCYEPRNAVVFLDENDRVKYYFEICFSCMHHYWSTSKVNNVIYCDGKYELLRKFFASQGVIYGTEPLDGD